MTDAWQEVETTNPHAMFEALSTLVSIDGDEEIVVEEATLTPRYINAIARARAALASHSGAELATKTIEQLAEFIHGALMASDTPVETFLSDPAGPAELARDIAEWLNGASVTEQEKP